MLNESDVFGVQWDEFINSLDDGRAQQPFLAQVIDSKDKPTWRLNAIAPKTVWIVNTVHIERRSWRTLDGALSDVERKMGRDFPPLTNFPNPSSFPNKHMGWVGHEQRLI